MTHDRDRVQEDLRGVIDGEVLCSEVITDLYAADAGPFRLHPLGVVRPRHAEDVVEVVKYASEHQIPVHPRGAGTSTAAQSLGRGIVIDFSRFMRRVLREEETKIAVEPGAVVGQLNRRLAQDRRTIGFEPWSNSVSTAAGVIARNAAGRYATGFGSPADHVLACQVVLADGSLIELGSHRLEPDLRGPTPPRVQQLVRRVGAILGNPIRQGSSSIRQPGSLGPGYALHNIIAEGAVAMARLLAGSEGALGLMTSATLRTVPLPKCSGVAPLFFDRVDRAAEAALLARHHSPDACDLLDRRHLTIIREADPRYEMAIPPWAEAMLVVEKSGDNDVEVREQLRCLEDQIAGQLPTASVGDVETDAADLDFYRFLAESAPRLLHRIGGRKRPVSLADDLIVEAEQLPSLIAGAQMLLQRTGITASLYAHATNGVLQLRPFLDLTSMEDRRHMKVLSEAVAELVWRHGGVLGSNAACAVVCGSHHSRAETTIPDALREIKQAFDAEGLLNPGKLIPTTPCSLDELLPPAHIYSAESHGQSLDEPKRVPDAAAATHVEAGGSPAMGRNGDEASLPVVSPEYGWSELDLYSAAAKCSGCGICRAEQDVRMCPIGHMAPREEASPRAKANLVRSLLAAPDNGHELEDSEFKAVADLCVHCHMCRIECPAEVDIPSLMVEAKAQHVRTNGLRLSDWLMMHVDAVSAFSRRVRHLSNWALGNKVARWILEKGTGLAQSRRLPMLDRRSFLEEAKRRRWTLPTTGTDKVAFFVDTYVNHYDTELGLALVSVLEHNGIMVWVPPMQKHAAMPMIARGALDPARDVARHNVAVFAEAVRQGYTIVATEPSAVLALTREYLALLPDDPDAQSVAEHTVEAGQYLRQLHGRQRLRLDFKRLDATVGYHAPCHLLALRVGTPAEKLLRLVPGLHVERLEHGCSGMAGTYGLQQKNYRNSLRAGLELLSAMRKTPLTAGTTECSTCRIQMQHGTDRPTVHPIKILALAYGLMPELKRHLFSGGRELTLQ